MLQLSASIEKSWLEKRRNIRVTICECCSHLFILGILYLGYGLSIIAFYPEKVYDSYQIEIPPTSSAGVISSLSLFLDGPLPVPSLDTFVTASNFLSAQAQGSGLISALSSSQFGARYNNLFEFGALHFAPYPSDEVDSLINYLNQVYFASSSFICFFYWHFDFLLLFTITAVYVILLVAIYLYACYGIRWYEIHSRQLRLRMDSCVNCST